MTNDHHVRELATLKAIAETLNQSNDLAFMLDTVLGRLLEVTGLTFGWIFLVGRNNEYECVADRNLPPGLLHEDKRLMRCGSCWCMDRYRDCRLTNAVNILNCKRLDTARTGKTGDTCGFTHHATVPLRIGERRFGILNVGAAGKTHFSAEELALLQAVAFQIGVAVERVRLHEAEQRRAELFARLGAFSRALAASPSGDDARARLKERSMRLIAEHFDWPLAALLDRCGQSFVPRGLSAGGALLTPPGRRIPLSDAAWLKEAAEHQGAKEWENADLSVLLPRQNDGDDSAAMAAQWPSVMTVPIVYGGGSACGVLLVARPEAGGLTAADGAVLEAIAEHMAVAMENVRFEEHRRELARLEERNRLARDLHDSVSQMLFSISMTAKGVEALLDGSDTARAKASVKDMQELSRDALKEMRTLIMQLRPPGIEKGIVEALKEYGARLGLLVSMRADGRLDLPAVVEEAIWRIGQEALNNAAKHGGSPEVDVTLSVRPHEAVLTIRDYGRGIELSRSGAPGQASYGLAIMQERAEALGGRFRLDSSAGQGTTVEAAIPLRPDQRGGLTER
ncbi:GAF domain-containing sensor histidine kinase [Paenibacillus arenilitoris]|uniref:Oxygen sensor histidine kinase NreB n=1 Tax=Paenibacillus arenilitoris TaxID=2772299 RepID=A0A927H557_9BACL|nr:GAF domain-containing sensor histidine kinase [Paenibacillus arenilitoris]MBD2868188.1 GAF domain-containing sensor histidine kinase [Paenibacillus arenilitoris]